MDPCVIVARAIAADGTSRVVDVAQLPYRSVVSGGCEHIRIDIAGDTLRLDVVEGSALAGPVAIEPAVDLGRDLEGQVAAIRRLDALSHGRDLPAARDMRLERLVQALRVIDARAAGASLRDIGLGILDGDDWPGDGEHIKSHARRLVLLGGELLSAGPAALLQSRI